MTDLIRREDAINSLRERFCGDCKPCAKCDVCDTNTLIRDMMRIPAVDAVEVVRCEDCCWYTPDKNYYGKVGRCHKYKHIIGVLNDGFCSLGVKKGVYET